MKQLLVVVLLLLAGRISAQHEGHTMPGMSMPGKPSTGKSMRGKSMPGKKVGEDSAGKQQPMRMKPGESMDHSMHGGMSTMTMPNNGLMMDSASGMTHSLSRHLPMNRNGSGTSWHPDNTPMYAYIKQPANSPWSYMLHYAVYLRYTRQNSNNAGKRGTGEQLGAPNWFMGMAQRKVGRRGLFQVRAMLSLDALTVGRGGYPLLFQTGESFRGQPLIDRQHPHDLVSELSVSYSHSFTKDIDGYAYVGYPGEPALGPPAFMHRISSFNIPDAPLGHHWQDATHILFGVATVGFRYKWAKIEGSTFKGREPDENRYNFDAPAFNSYSYRVSVNPSPSLAFQFSQGYLRSPEEAHPGENVTRTTASVLHSKGLGPTRYVTSALVWGQNKIGGSLQNSYLAESSLQLDKLAVYGRYENVGKSAEELGLVGQVDLPERILTINNLTLGVNYLLAQRHNTNLTLGAQLTASVPDKRLQTIYGKAPVSGEVYLRLNPALMTMKSMQNRRM